MAAAPLIVTTEREEVVDFTWAFLHLETVIILHCGHQIHSLRDLVEQDDIRFGISALNPVLKEMKDSTDEVAQKAWRYLSQTNGTVLENNNAGFWEVFWDDKFAFLIDSVSADWVLRQTFACGLRAVKTGYFRKWFSFAVPNMSPLRDELNRELTRMRVSLKIQELYEKWWGEDVCLGPQGQDRCTVWEADTEPEPVPEAEPEPEPSGSVSLKPAFLWLVLMLALSA